VITIGIDPHKRSLTAAALDPHSRLLGQLRVGAARTHPITPVDAERKRIAHQLLADVRRLDRQVKTASQASRTAVREHGTTLTRV
jgi:hypothetical protein